jgi:hypothetical protein
MRRVTAVSQGYNYSHMRAIISPDGGAYSYADTDYANPDAPTQIANGLSTTTFTYDNNGNVTQKTVDGTTTTYVYIREREQQKLRVHGYLPAAGEAPRPATGVDGLLQFGPSVGSDVSDEPQYCQASWRDLPREPVLWLAMTPFSACLQSQPTKFSE